MDITKWETKKKEVFENQENWFMSSCTRNYMFLLVPKVSNSYDTKWKFTINWDQIFQKHYVNYIKASKKYINPRTCTSDNRESNVHFEWKI